MYQHTLKRFGHIICQLLAATIFAVGCRSSTSRQSYSNVRETAQTPRPNENRLSAGETVLLTLDSNVTAEPVTLTRKIDNDGSISVYNSMRFVAIDLTPDELAARIRYALITNLFHIRGFVVERVQQVSAPNERQ